MRTGTTTLKTLGRTLYLAFVLGVAANVGSMVWHIAVPDTAPKVAAATVGSGDPAYMTGALGSWHGRLPLARPVKVVDHIAVDGQAAPKDGVWAGQYDPVDGAITVIRSAGDLTLAHEYGHALLLALIEQRTGPGAPALRVFQQLEDAGRSTDPDLVPEWLRSMFREYRGLPSDPYGDVYYGASFNEYFAETFAWTADRDGIDVAPVALALFASLEHVSH